MNEFLKRNLPILLIGILTVGIFGGIIVLSQFKKENPTPQKVEIVPEETLVSTDSLYVGKEDAPVVLVEFADFECPACKVFSPIIKKFYNDNQDIIKVVLKHYPLPQHTLAKSAANAAEAAGEQGKFWEYATVLYENQPNFSRDNYIKFAGDIGLDVTKFANDLDANKYNDKIKRDMDLANSLNVNATPTFYLNGKKMVFSTFDDFTQQIQDEINKAKESMNIEVQNGNEVPREPLTNTRTETVAINYTTDIGLKPANVTAYTGQIVRITNQTDKDLTLLQIGDFFPEYKEKEIIIKASEYLEKKMEKEGMWTFKEKESDQGGSVYIRGN